MCVERDSKRDEAVVFIFIFATAGLLAWAVVKPWVSKWIEVCFLPLSCQLVPAAFSPWWFIRARLRETEELIFPSPGMPINNCMTAMIPGVQRYGVGAL